MTLVFSVHLDPVFPHVAPSEHELFMVTHNTMTRSSFWRTCQMHNGYG
jgi:hypothetical protein